MWGESARPSSRHRDGASAAASIDGESDITVTDPAASHPLVHTSDEDEASFRRRSARFDETERSYNNLMRALDEHKVALAKVAESGVAVAEQLHKFFRDKDSHRELAASFLSAQRAAHGTWTSFERRYDKDVVSHIKNRVDEIPLVRAGMKQRASALTEMRRLQRKTASERKVDGPFAKVKQRRLKELKDVSAVYAMYHSNVMHMFSNIERNSGKFVSPALVALVSLLSDVGQATVTSLENVQKLAEDVPPMTRELSPAPMSETRVRTQTLDGAHETWDEDFEDMVVSPALSPSMRPVAGDASSTGTHTRSRSEPLNNSPSVHSVPPTEKRRVVHSTDTASLPEVLGSRSGQYAPRQPEENGYAHGDSTPALPNSNRPGAGASGSSSSGERGDDDTATVNGGGSEVSGRRERIRHDGKDRRRGREGMGSSDTVPSEGGVTNRAEVLMRLMVLHDFMPREVNEIEMRKGDVVEVTEKNDAGWWFGRCRKSTGWFPRNYTRELTDKEEADFVSNRHRKRRQGHRRHNSRDSRKSTTLPAPG